MLRIHLKQTRSQALSVLPTKSASHLSSCLQAHCPVKAGSSAGWCCCHSVTHRARRCVAPWTAARQASPSFTISRSLLKLMSTESVMPSNHLILCRPLLLLPSIFPSIRVFSFKSVSWLPCYHHIELAKMQIPSYLVVWGKGLRKTSYRSDSQPGVQIGSEKECGKGIAEKAQPEQNYGVGTKCGVSMKNLKF